MAHSHKINIIFLSLLLFVTNTYSFKYSRNGASSSKIFTSCVQARLDTNTINTRDISLSAFTDSGRDLVTSINGVDIFYDLVRSSKLSSAPSPAILFLPGLIREKNEAKSIYLKTLCKRADITFLCADYVGVGRSKGLFTDGSVSRWASDTIALIENIIAPAERRVLLVGHGIGAWISFVVALKRPDLVSGIVGMAADPDFTEELLWKKLPEDVKDKIMNEGSCTITWGKQKYPISRNLIEDGRQNLLLTAEPGSIQVKCPVRLIHGLQDEEVPYTFAMKLMENIASTDSSLILLKKSKHSMDSESDHKALRSMIAEVIGTTYGDYDLRSPGSG